MHVYLYELCCLGDAKNWNETSCLQFAVLDFFTSSRTIINI